MGISKAIAMPENPVLFDQYKGEIEIYFNNSGLNIECEPM
jgi:hypothetical protein